KWDSAQFVRRHGEFISRPRSDPGAPVAEWEPRSARAATRPTAADRRRLDLDTESRDDPRGSGLLQCGGALDRHAAHVRVLQREPAQDARLASGSLGVLERGAV